MQLNKTTSTNHICNQKTQGNTAMTNLTINDLNNEVNHEPRIEDIRLGEFLGFAKPIKIRELIKRHIEALEKLGTISTVGTVKRGQKSTTYYLNKKQCVFVCTKSETAAATEKTIEVIEVYDAHLKGTLQPIAAPAPAAPQPALPDAHVGGLKMIALLSEICEDIEAIKEHGDNAEVRNMRRININGTLAQITRLIGNPHRAFRGALIPQAAYDIIHLPTPQPKPVMIASSNTHEPKQPSKMALAKRASRERIKLRQMEAA